MLSPGDGIALAGIAGIVIVGVLRSKKPNGYVLRKECDVRIDGFKTELKNIRMQLSEIDRFLREGRV